MTNLEKYHHTISVLLKAYLNETLEKGNQCGCAVGNLIADSCGLTLRIGNFGNYRVDADNMPDWLYNICTSENGYQELEEEDIEVDVQQAFTATGYSFKELARIEYAFETAAEGYTPEAEYAGLMAVVEVLADIHQLDKQEAEQSKLLFVK